MLNNFVTTLIPDFTTVVAVAVIMFVKNPVLAAASLCSLPLMMACIWLIQVYSHKKWQDFRRKSSNLNAFIHEDMSGMRIIQSFGAQEETISTFDELLAEHRGSFVRAVRLNDAMGSAIDFSWGIGIAALYFVGVRILGVGTVSIGTFIAFGSYIGMFWNPIMNLSNFYNQIITNIAAAERIFEIMDTEPAITDDTKVTEIPPIKGAVSFEHVSFSYDGITKVLNDVSFSIKPGETIALVGPTGAGKTTIVNLISRFYDIQEGIIRIDDYDVKTVTIESLRSQMGIMTQDNFLFTGTIRDNIRYGKLDATEEEIIEAAKAVHAHDFICQLEKGYDTVLTERGGGLSVGQKQLLAFARTMVSKPNILILDEATSSIDTHTELLVQEGIDALLKGRTSFVIAHRLSTIQKADRIFVIDHGGIVEQGTVTELLERRAHITDFTLPRCCHKKAPQSKTPPKVLLLGTLYFTLTAELSSLIFHFPLVFSSPVSNQLGGRSFFGLHSGLKSIIHLWNKVSANLHIAVKIHKFINRMREISSILGRRFIGNADPWHSCILLLGSPYVDHSCCFRALLKISKPE